MSPPPPSPIPIPPGARDKENAKAPGTENTLGYPRNPSPRTLAWAQARNRAPTFLLEIETPIEVEHFDPHKPLYYRTFQKSDVQKHKVFD